MGAVPPCPDPFPSLAYALPEVYRLSHFGPIIGRQDSRKSRCNIPFASSSYQRLRSACIHFRCCARCLFISNMVTFFFPNTGSSLASARISRRFAGFCSSCCLMYSQTLRTTSPRGRGPEPITAASSLDGCSGCCSPLGFWPPPPAASFFDPVGPLLALVGMVVL